MVGIVVIIGRKRGTYGLQRDEMYVDWIESTSKEASKFGHDGQRHHLRILREET